jgi:hypothetical protein
VKRQRRRQGKQRERSGDAGRPTAPIIAVVAP